jgi:hypothetical protein
MQVSLFYDWDVWFFLIMGHTNGSTAGHISVKREVCSYVFVRVGYSVCISIG